MTQNEKPTKPNETDQMKKLRGIIENYFKESTMEEWGFDVSVKQQALISSSFVTVWLYKKGGGGITLTRDNVEIDLDPAELAWQEYDYINRIIKYYKEYSEAWDSYDNEMRLFALGEAINKVCANYHWFNWSFYHFQHNEKEVMLRSKDDEFILISKTGVRSGETWLDLNVLNEIRVFKEISDLLKEKTE